MGVQRSQEFFDDSQNSLPNLYKDLVTLQIFMRGKTHTIVSWKRNGTYVGFLLNKNFTSQAINNVLNHLNNPNKWFLVKEFWIKVSEKNNKILEALKATNDEIMNILLENHLTQSSNNSEEFPETTHGIEYQTSHQLYEYTANNRKKFYVLMNENDEIVSVVAKNWPLSFASDMQKKHIAQKWQDQEKNRFTKVEKSSKTSAIISQIENKIRLKQLWHVKHPEISGEFIYTNSHWEDFVVVVENGKVISLLPNDVSPQQKGAIQKKLNLLWEDAFHAKVQAQTLQELVWENQEEFVYPDQRKFDLLYSEIKNGENILVAKDGYQDQKLEIIQRVFSLIQTHFPEYSIVLEPKKSFDKSFLHFQVFLKKIRDRYPYMKQNTEFVAKMMNTIKDLLS